MADKKISALTAVADSDIGADDLLHIVDNPGGTPVNKKMTIGQLFENVPTFLAVDDIASLTATASNLASTFGTAFDGGSFSAHTSFTLDNGTNTGQLKVLWMKSFHGSSYEARVTVSSWGYSSTTTNQIVFDALGEAAILIWDGNNWFPLGTVGATLT